MNRVRAFETRSHILSPCVNVFCHASSCHAHWQCWGSSITWPLSPQLYVRIIKCTRCMCYGKSLVMLYLCNQAATLKQCYDEGRGEGGLWQAVVCSA